MALTRMTDPTQVQMQPSRQHELQSIPKDLPLERSGKKGWYITGGLLLIAVVRCIFGQAATGLLPVTHL